MAESEGVLPSTRHSRQQRRSRDPGSLEYRSWLHWSYFKSYSTYWHLFSTCPSTARWEGWLQIRQNDYLQCPCRAVMLYLRNPTAMHTFFILLVELFATYCYLCQWVCSHVGSVAIGHCCRTSDVRHYKILSHWPRCYLPEARISVYGYLRLSRDSARAVDLGEVVARIFTFTKPSAACPLLLSNLYSFIV